MQDHLIVQLNNGNNTIIEVYGHKEDSNTVFNSFIAETQKYTVYQLEKYNKLKINLVCKTRQLSVKIPDSVNRFSNLWDAPIHVIFSN